MGQAHSLQTRKQIDKLRKQGYSRLEISEKLGLPFYTVRTLCRRFAVGESLMPDYSRCGVTSPITEKIRKASVRMKKQHPTWGAGYIKIELESRYPTYRIPSESTLRGYFRVAGVATPMKKRRVRYTTEREQWAGTEHHVWQVDSVEKQRLRNGKPVSWMSVVDEYSGALLAGKHFPPQADDTGSRESCCNQISSSV